MTKVGIMSIVLGLLVIATRGPLLVAPKSALRTLQRVIETNARLRVAGTLVIPLGGVMVWAAAGQHSALATILSVAGWLIMGVSTIMLILFPGAYRLIAEAVLPDDPDEDLLGWRFLGLLGVVIGALLIYYGVLAL